MIKTAKILRENIPVIMKLWERDVTKEVPAAKAADKIALYDHLPDIINDIADIMERHDESFDINKDEKYIEILENSYHHGRHRATTEHYTVDQIIHEYIIFHRTLTVFIKSMEGYHEDVFDLLKYVVETSILKSVGSFSASLQEMQEKLIGTLAHDIRNPLSAAQSCLNLIQQEEDAEWREKLRVAAERSVRKALSLIESLMDGITVKAGEGMMFSFEECDILEDITWIHSEANEVYVNEIILECSENTIVGVFDTVAIRRLLENLIGNAIKYGRHSRPITITVKVIKDKLEIDVHNFGNPISTDKQKHIFGFLNQEHTEGGIERNSWGMGLTLALIVAQAHGGTISLASDEDTGTVFSVTLLKTFNKPGKKRTKLSIV